MPLLSRRIFPPNGFLFFQPQTQWPKDQGVFAGKTFDEVVGMIRAHRLANPRFNLATDVETIGNELDLFTCVRIANNPAYCTGGPVPKAQRPPRGRVAGVAQAVVESAGAVVEKAKKYVSGISVLLSWLGSGAKTVPQEVSNKRAEICSACPQNQPGGLDSIFTEIAADKIRSQLRLREEMDVKTDSDSKLYVCMACLCHLKLKCHVPINYILQKLKPEMKRQLDSRCWILSEERSQKDASPD